MYRLQTLSRRIPVITLNLVAAATCLVPLNVACGEEPIAIAEVKHEGPVDFEQEILPILRKNCLACHNSTKAEGSLVLETPETIRKGGSEGPAVVAGKAGESLLLMLASRQRESFMPPDGNDVGAKKLTSDELGLIKLWVDQGAEGVVTGAGSQIVWQSLPAGVNPIYAVALTGDGQFAASGRANQVFLYHIPSKRELGRLTDPALLESGIYTNPGVADLDMVQSLAFSPDSERLVSGGFRTAKIWRRQHNVRLGELAGLEGGATCVAVSPDASTVAIGEPSGKVRLFTLADQKLVATLEGHSAVVSGLAWSADNQRLVTAGQDSTLRVWNRDGTALTLITAPSPLNDVILVDGNQLAATAGADHQVLLWDLAAAATAAGDAATPPAPLRALTGHGQPVTSLARISDAQILSGSLDGTLRVWQVADGKQVREIPHGGPVVDVAVRADGQRFASASAEHKSAKIWNAADGKQLQELRGDYRLQLTEAALARDAALAKRLIDLAGGDVKAANDRKTAEEENQKKADEEQKKAAEELAKKVEAAKEPVAKKVEAEKELETVMAEVVAAEQRKKTADEELPKAMEAVKVAVAAVEEEAKKVAAAEEVLKKAEEMMKAAVAAKAKAEQTMKDAEAAVVAATETQKKSEQELAAATAKVKPAEEKVKQVAPAAQKAIDEQTAAERTVESATRAAERAAQSVQKAAEAIPPLEKAVEARTADHQQAEARATAAKEATAAKQIGCLAVAFSPDQATLFTSGDDQTLRIWDVESGSPIDVIEGTGAAVRALAGLPNGSLLSAAENGSAVIWQTQPAWVLERTIGSPDKADAFVDRVTALDVSPDGKLLATGTGEPSRSGVIAIWNLETGELVRQLPEAHSDEIFALDFSRDGAMLVSSAADRFVKIFEVATGNFVRAFEGHTHHVLGVAWSSDGRQLASSGADKVLKIWNALTGDQQRTIQGFNKEVTAVRYVGDSEQIIASSGDASVQMKNAGNGGNVRSFGGASDFMYAVDTSADGTVIIAGGQDSILRVWKQDGNSLATFGPPAPPAEK